MLEEFPLHSAALLGGSDEIKWNFVEEVFRGSPEKDLLLRTFKYFLLHKLPKYLKLPNKKPVVIIASTSSSLLSSQSSLLVYCLKVCKHLIISAYILSRG